MNLQDVAHMPHVEGYVQLTDVDPGSAELEVTTRVHQSGGGAGRKARYSRHPLHDQLAGSAPDGRLRRIPIRVMFDRPEHNLHARYQAWSDSYEHGPCCVGNGEVAARLDGAQAVWKSTLCAGPELCPAVREKKLDCALEVRLRVMIDGQPDPLQTWVVRSKSENSHHSLMGALVHLRAMFGGLRHLPLELTTYQMSTRASNYQPFTCLWLGLRDGTSIQDAMALKSDCSAEVEAMGAAALRAWNGAITGPGGVVEDRVNPVDAFQEPGPADRDTATASLFAEAVDAAKSAGHS